MVYQVASASIPLISPGFGRLLTFYGYFVPLVLGYVKTQNMYVRYFIFTADRVDSFSRDIHLARARGLDTQVRCYLSTAVQGIMPE